MSKLKRGICSQQLYPTSAGSTFLSVISKRNIYHGNYGLPTIFNRFSKLGGVVHCWTFREVSEVFNSISGALQKGFPGFTDETL